MRNYLDQIFKTEMILNYKSLVKNIANKLLSLGEQYRREEIYRRYNLSSSVKFHNISLEGTIIIGNNTYINDYTRIDSGLNSTVIIGENCAIGRFVHISSKTHDLNRPTSDNNNESLKELESNVIIGNEVWIGDHCYIGPGVTIGNNAIIGAFGFVNRDVKEFEIVGGIPIKHIRFNNKHYKYNNRE